MIGTIRKHSAWLWWVVAGLTIISFVIFMGQGGTRFGTHGGLGTIYGKPVTPEAYDAAMREFCIYYWHQTGQFPNKNPNFSSTDLERETYVRLMLTAKAKELGIHVGEEAQVAMANEFLSSLSRDHKPVPMNVFVERVLDPEHLTTADFQRFIIDDLSIQQLIESLGLSGALISPQEASQLYDRANQEYSAQAVFFSASNYLSQVSATPTAVSLFYSNYMAYYRLPDRLQVNYVKYDLSNFIASAEAKIGKTNLDSQVESIYAEHGMEVAPDAKTPQEAKAKIRELVVRQAGAKAALDQAMQFVTPLFAMDPALPENLVTLAQKDGLTVHSTTLFNETEGPIEFVAPSDLVKEMFKLNAESPFIQKPFVGSDAVYVIGLAKQIPSEIQPFSDIHDRVVEDYKNYEATLKARTAGTNFYFNAALQVATGKSFAQVALAAGQAPVALTPFSLSTNSIPEAEGHAEVRQIQNAAYSTQVGHISPFEASADGGFVLYVKSILPVDLIARNENLPGFIAQMRHSRETEAFNLWLEAEANRELVNTPVAQELMAGKAARRSP